MGVTGWIVEAGPLGLLVGAFLTLLAVVWLLMLFALFGLKRRVEGLRFEIAKTREALVAEQRRTNELLGGERTPRAPEDRAVPLAATKARPTDEAVPGGRRPLVARRD